MTDKFIVAELTKNWKFSSTVRDLIGQQFEGVINRNLQRGYKLIDWKLNQVVYGEIFTETIIAIFERIEHGDPKFGEYFKSE